MSTRSATGAASASDGSLAAAGAADRSKAVIKGYLRKQSSSGSWQRRWFEAVSHYLTYYKTTESTEILACIDLRKVGKIVMVKPTAPANDEQAADFSIELNGRVYLMRAKSAMEARRWVETLNRIRDTDSTASPVDVTVNMDGRKLETMSLDQSNASATVEKSRRKTCGCC